ncbi:MAG: hypothetical protein WCO30_02615, partial [bacterium]
VATSGYVYYKNTNNSKLIEVSNGEKKLNTVVDKFAGWKTYANEELGFEIKHPQEWGVEENKYGVLIYNKDEKSKTRPDTGDPYSSVAVITDDRCVPSGWVDGYASFLNKTICLNSDSLKLVLTASNDDTTKVGELIASSFKTITGEFVGWKTYKFPEQKYSIKYPNYLTLKESKDGFVLGHSIVSKHPNACDFKGDSKPLENLTDFNVSFNVINKSVKDLVDGSSYPGWKYVSSNPFSSGDIKGYKIMSGIEGCGTYDYYLSISPSKTLLIKRLLITELGSSVLDKEKYLSLPGVIKPNQEEELFNKILSTFREMAPVVSDQTSNWQTYYNADAGYQIKYPAGFSVKEEEHFFLDIKSSAIVFEYPASYSNSTNLDSAKVYISVMPTCPLNIGPYVKMSPENVSFVSGKNTFVVANSSDAAMGGQRGLYGNYMLEKNNRCYVIQKEIAYHDLDFLKAAGASVIPKAYDQDTVDTVFQKMLSTFEISPAVSLNQMSDWSTYTDSQLNISFKYPKNWTVSQIKETLGVGGSLYVVGLKISPQKTSVSAYGSKDYIAIGGQRISTCSDVPTATLCYGGGKENNTVTYTYSDDPTIKNVTGLVYDSMSTKQAVSIQNSVANSIPAGTYGNDRFGFYFDYPSDNFVLLDSKVLGDMYAVSSYAKAGDILFYSSLVPKSAIDKVKNGQLCPAGESGLSRPCGYTSGGSVDIYVINTDIETYVNSKATEFRVSCGQVSISGNDSFCLEAGAEGDGVVDYIFSLGIGKTLVISKNYVYYQNFGATDYHKLLSTDSLDKIVIN